MAFTQVTAAGISTGNSLTIQELNTVGVITAATVQVGSATTIHTTGIDLGSGNITSHNINSTGIITATGAVITGNLQVEGTTTTLDSLVTEVDKLEVAANNTNVAVAVTQSGTGDILNLYDGSTEVFTVTDGGKIGVGKNPGKILDLQATSGLAIRYYNESTFRAGLEVATNPGDMVGTSSAGDFCIRSQSNMLFSSGGNTERVRIDSSGRLLVGTGSAQGNNSLQIEGDAASTANPGGIFLRRGLTSAEIGNVVGRDLGYINFGTKSGDIGAQILAKSDATMSAGNSPGRLVFLTTGGGSSTPTERLRITSSGNVGIGTDNVQAKLHIKTPSGTDTPGSINSHLLFDLADDSGPGWVQRVWDSGAGTLGLDGSFAIDRRHGGVWTNTLTIKRSNGYVGIGTNNPTRKLDVEIQTASSAVGSVLSSHPIAEFINISAGAPRGLEIGAPPDGILSPVYLKVSGTSSRFSILDQSDHENFTILDNGRVGIGTNNPGAILEVAAAANAQRHLRVITHNSGDSCLQSVYPSNGTLRSIALEGSTVDFYTGSGSDTTGTFRGRFDSSGSLGINTTAPGARLDVRGSAYLSPLTLTAGGDGSWIKSAYGAISNSVVSSLNNLLIGQNMRGYLNSDGGSTNNNYYHTNTYSSGTMGYAGLEFGYGGLAKFFTGTPATTANATFTPTERLRINASGNISMGKAEDAVSWGGGVPTFEITGNSGGYPTRGGFIALESQSKVNGYGGMWLNNDTLSFYLGQARNSLQTPVERLRITYNSSPSVGITTNGVFHVTQNLPLTIQGQGFGHGWTQGGTQQDAIYLTAGASGTFTALTLSVDKGSWGSMCYEIHAHAYSGRYVHRLGGWYQNGGSFNQYGTTTYGDSNASFAFNAPGSQQFTITLSGGNWTHPVAWLRLVHSGNGSLNYNNISFRWS